ncbi:MAG: diguanylate cyclase [Pseudomonadota bacterium]
MNQAISTHHDAEKSLILIIDDSVDNIRLLSGMLKGQGQIIFAMNGDAGIELARQRQPQLILLDVEMPDMDGYQVCRKLKADPETRSSAVIFVTAHASMSSEIEALEAGGLDFITKPLNPPVVRARVHTHLTLQRHTAALEHLANRDGLTGLYNRRYFDQQLEREFDRHKRQRLSLGIAFIDLDHFKAFNDGYGHAEGDTCLKTVAEAISTATRRPGEVAARYGGEEFVCVLPYTTIEGMQNYGEWICSRVRELNLVHGYSPTSSYVTISIGLTAEVPPESGTTQKMMANADRALYEAKSAGRNCSKIVVS